MISFKELSAQFNLTPEYSEQSPNQSLASWCREHISQDEHPNNASAEECYLRNIELAKNYLDVFLIHLPAELSVLVPEFEGMNAIQYAAKQGYDLFLKETTIPTPLLDEPNVNGMTPLHLGAVYGHLHVCKELLAKGADLKKPNAYGQLPIQSALVLPILYDESTRQQKMDIVRLFIAANPLQISYQNDHGETLFHFMAPNPFAELLEELLKKNSSSALQQDALGLYPIHMAVRNGQLKNVEILLQLPDVATQTDGKKRTPLHDAARYGSPEMMTLCCNGSSHLNPQDSEGMTPLLLAVEARNLPTMEVLIQRGADMTLLDYVGRNILHHAVLSQSESVVRWVLENTKVDVNQTDKLQQTPLDYAESEDIKNLLLEHGAQNLN